MINLNDALQFLVSDKGTAAWVGGCLLFFLWHLIGFWKKVKPVRVEVEVAVKAISAAASPTEFAERFEEIRERIEALPLLRHGWLEFTEALILPDGEAHDGRLVIRNTRHPQNYFSQRYLLAPRANLRIYNALPNMLTGLGILGTFVGLVAGIWLAAPGLNSQDINDAKGALQILLHGAALAFITSIAGLVLSIAYSFFEKRVLHKFEGAVGALNNALERRMDFESVERIADRSFEEARKQTNVLSTFSNDLAIALGQQMELSVTAPMGELFREMKDSLDALAKNQSRASDETIERLIQEFARSIQGSAGEEMKNLAATMERVSGDLERQISSMAEGQRQIQESTQKTIHDLAQSFDQASQRLQADLFALMTDIVRGVKGAVSDMTGLLREATLESTENMKRISEQFAQSMQTLQQTVIGIVEITRRTDSLLERIDQLVAQSHDATGALSSIITSLQEVAADIQVSSGNISESVFQLKQAEQLSAQASQSLSQLHRETTEMWKHYVERFKSTDQALEKVFDELTEGLSRYAQMTRDYVGQLDAHAGKICSQLGGAVQDLQSVVEEIASVK